MEMGEVDDHVRVDKGQLEDFRVPASELGGAGSDACQVDSGESFGPHRQWVRTV